MFSKVEILRKIYAYLRNEIDLLSFRDWVVEAQLELEHENSDSDAKRLVWEIEGIYAEFSDGLVEESLWRNSLRALAEQERAGTEAMVFASVEVFRAEPSFGQNPASNPVPIVAPELVPCETR